MNYSTRQRPPESRNTPALMERRAELGLASSILPAVEPRVRGERVAR
jgi:hypothetical protein